MYLDGPKGWQVASLTWLKGSARLRQVSVFGAPPKWLRCSFCFPLQTNQSDFRTKKTEPFAWDDPWLDNHKKIRYFNHMGNAIHLGHIQTADMPKQGHSSSLHVQRVGLLGELLPSLCQETILRAICLKWGLTVQTDRLL